MNLEDISYWLSLDDMTGRQGTAQAYLETIKGTMHKMEIAGGQQVLALTTDNPTVMQAFQRDFQKEFNWVLVQKISSFGDFAAKFVIYGPYVDSPLLSTWFEYNNQEDCCIWAHKACYHSIYLCGLIF